MTTIFQQIITYLTWDEFLGDVDFGDEVLVTEDVQGGGTELYDGPVVSFEPLTVLYQSDGKQLPRTVDPQKVAGINLYKK